MMANNQWLCESESNSYHWLSLDGLKSIISMNPYEHLLSEKSRIKKKSQFLIDNKQHLCEHGGFHPMTARKVKYIPDNVYTLTKDTFKKHLQSKSVLGFDPSEGITHFNKHYFSYKNMRCGVCIKELWDDMSSKIDLLKELHTLVKALNKFQSSWRKKYGVCKKFITKLTDYFFPIIDLGTTSFGK